jgi:uncharacterized protein with GYD domain
MSSQRTVLFRGGLSMATFITLIKFTPQGVTNIQDTCKRAAAFKAAAKKLGGKVTATYWTQGPFDGVLIFEADDDQTASALMVHLASQGYVQTQTVPAHTAAEMEKVLAAAGQ